MQGGISRPNSDLRGNRILYTENNQQADDALAETYTKDHFKQLILTTYNDWYYDRTTAWDYADFFEVIKENKLERELGPNLFNEDSNLMNLSNLPFLDLGDKPSTYGPNRPESEQMFVVPKSQYPESMIVKYLNCKSSF